MCLREDGLQKQLSMKHELQMPMMVISQSDQQMITKNHFLKNVGKWTSFCWE